MEWQQQDNSLYKKYKFQNFLLAIKFMDLASIEIDKVNHHPVWTNVYNGVEVWLSTHDAGNIITDKDRKLAEILDDIYASF